MTDNVLSVKLEMLHTDVVEVKTALNELSKAITKLALVEQQQTQTVEAMERAFKAITRIEERLTLLEHSARKGSETSAWMDKFITALIIGVLVYAGTKLGLVQR